MADKNELMVAAFEGVYLIQIDVDDWDWNDLPTYGFDFEGIPIFYKLDAQGNPTGELVDGNAWGANTPANMAPVMDEFFHGN